MPATPPYGTKKAADLVAAQHDGKSLRLATEVVWPLRQFLSVPADRAKASRCGAAPGRLARYTSGSELWLQFRHEASRETQQQNGALPRPSPVTAAPRSQFDRRNLFAATSSRPSSIYACQCRRGPGRELAAKLGDQIRPTAEARKKTPPLCEGRTHPCGHRPGIRGPLTRAWLRSPSTDPRPPAPARHTSQRGRRPCRWPSPGFRPRPHAKPPP